MKPDPGRAALYLQRLLDGDDSAETLAWLRQAARRFWDAGIPLENALHLPGGSRATRIACRDTWLFEAARHSGERSIVRQAAAILEAAAGHPSNPALRLCVARALSCWPLPSSVSQMRQILAAVGENGIGSQKLRATG